MKKFLLIACGLAMACTATAQDSVLKEAERGLKVEVPDHAGIAAKLKGAMTDPTTAGNVKTWYLAGKNAFQTWQTGWEQLQIGGNPDKVNMSKSIIEGFDYYTKAFTMDTVITDAAKGKFKAKYSKEMVKTITGNVNNFYDAGVYLYEAQDLPGAYRAWEIFTILPTMPQLGKDAPAMPADSILAQTYYNMGIFAYQADMKPEALSSFMNSAKYGMGEIAYDNALSMASELNDIAAMETIANEGFAKYGKQTYIGSLVNVYVKNGEFEKALDMINKAIAANPDNSVLFNVKGVLIENRTNDENISAEDAAKANAEALELYKKAVEFDGENPDARFNYGRMLANKAYKTSDDAGELSNAEYNKLKEDTINLLFVRAAEQLEKAISINKESNRQAFSILKNIYYNLNDEANMKRIADLELE